MALACPPEDAGLDPESGAIVPVDEEAGAYALSTAKVSTIPHCVCSL
jgi:hypothetical protein